MNEYLTTRELAELLRIKERKVYDLASSGAIPCSRATGKLLFPRRAIEAWLASKESSPGEEMARPLVMLGSHDPLLEWALRASQCGLASYFDSSSDGLDRFSKNEGIASGLHLYDIETDSWNLTSVSARFARAGVVLVRWAKRARGIIVQPDAASSYSGLADLRGKSVVPRQPGAGSQVVLDALLQHKEVNGADIGWTSVARSEADAVLEVVEGRAQATFGLATLASQYRLGFVPIVDEHYDLMVERRAWFEPTWQSFLQFCQSQEFRSRASELAGYRIENQFCVRFNSTA